MGDHKPSIFSFIGGKGPASPAAVREVDNRMDNFRPEDFRKSPPKVKFGIQ